MAAQTWQDVAGVLVNRFPAGPGNRGWEREQVAGFIAELQASNLEPNMAVIGLRASLSEFIPSTGAVVRLYRESLPPLTAVEIEEAWEAQKARREAGRLAERDDAIRELGAG